MDTQKWMIGMANKEHADVVDEEGFTRFTITVPHTNDVSRYTQIVVSAPEMLSALVNASEVLTLLWHLMPGIKHLAPQDYGFINDTLMQVTAAINKATHTNTPYTLDEVMSMFKITNTETQP